MQYTRETIKSLHEDRLQRDVLVPLFRAMGFRDVTLYHGGVREQGKDIVMWKYDELGLRQNWAAVVKATKITGQATGRGSAGEVCTQVRQAFADPFRDPKSGTERIVSRCFVVSSKTIKKDSIVSIQNILKGTPAERATQFINGETLWDLIEEHLPKSAIWERFTAAQELLSEVNPDYHLRARTSSSGVEVEVGPPRAPDAPPLTFNTRLAFPDTPEGRQARESFEDFLDYGAPVHLKSDFIESMDLPEWLQSLLSASDAEGFEISLQSRKLGKPIWARLRMSHAEDNLSFEPLILEVVQAGRKGFTVSNRDQDIPWKVEFQLEPKMKKGHFHIERTGGEWNVQAELNVLRFIDLVAKGGKITIEDMNSGLTLLNEDIEGTIGYPSEKWKDFLNAAVEIQEKIEKPLALPDREITGEEVQAVLELSGRLERGHTEFAADTVRLEMNREGLENLLKEFDKAGEVKDLTIRQIEEVEVLDTTVPLGEVVYVFGAKLPEREGKKLRHFLSEGDGESLEVIIDVSARPVKVLYLRWYEEGPEVSKKLNMALES